MNHSEEEIKQFEANLARLKELAGNKTKTHEEVMEFVDLEQAVENFKQPLTEKVTEILQESIKNTFAQENEPFHKMNEQLLAERNAKIEQQKEKMQKIKAGISNPEAEQYVKTLIKDNQAMQRQLALLNLEVKALKANNNNLVEKMRSEIESFSSFKSSMVDTLDCFSAQLLAIANVHTVVEDKNESNQPQSGTN